MQFIGPMLFNPSSLRIFYGTWKHYSKNYMAEKILQKSRAREGWLWTRGSSPCPVCSEEPLLLGGWPGRSAFITPLCWGWPWDPFSQWTGSQWCVPLLSLSFKKVFALSFLSPPPICGQRLVTVKPQVTGEPQDGRGLGCDSWLRAKPPANQSACLGQFDEWEINRVLRR